MKPLLINGEWRTTPTGSENINPSDVSEVIDVYATAGIMGDTGGH